MIPRLERKALIKWTLITCLCGAYSFVLGFAVTKGTCIPMLLGMATLILFFSAIESHPKYQALRGRDVLFAKSMDLSVKIRCFIAVYISLLALTMGILHDMGNSLMTILLLLPQMLEVYIGIGTVWFTKMIFGFDLSSSYDAVQPIGVTPRAPQTFIYYFATYFTTVTTGLVHTVILAVLCLLVYGVRKYGHVQIKIP